MLAGGGASSIVEVAPASRVLPSSFQGAIFLEGCN